MRPAVRIPPEEFRERRRRAADAARERGLDGLLVWAKGGASVDFYGDVFYLTNHHSPFPPNQDTPKWSARSYSCLVVPVDGEPTLVMDLPDYPEDQIHVDDVRFSLKVAHTSAEVLAERGVDRARLGLIGKDAFLMSHQRLLESELGHGLDLVPADDILERLRSVKSAGELELTRRAADIGVEAMTAMMEAVDVGRTEGEIVGEGYRRLAALGGYPYDIAIASGPESHHFFSRIGIPTWNSERKLEPGDLVHIDAWGPVDGYYFDFVRSTVVGRRPTGPQREVLEGALAIIDDLAQFVKPGVEIGQVYQRGAAWLVDNGFGRHGGAMDESGTDFGKLFPAFGHGIGVGLEPPWIIEDEPWVVEESMTLALEALVARPRVGGAGCEQNVIVSAEGCEIITNGCPLRWWS